MYKQVFGEAFMYWMEDGGTWVIGGTAVGSDDFAARESGQAWETWHAPSANFVQETSVTVVAVASTTTIDDPYASYGMAMYLANSHPAAVGSNDADKFEWSESTVVGGKYISGTLLRTVVVHLACDDGRAIITSGRCLPSSTTSVPITMLVRRTYHGINASTPQ
eukprot:SAG11_NODE_5866_length_1445_cov_1.049777_1_plen_164_part_00